MQTSGSMEDRRARAAVGSLLRACERVRTILAAAARRYNEWANIVTEEKYLESHLPGLLGAPGLGVASQAAAAHAARRSTAWQQVLATEADLAAVVATVEAVEVPAAGCSGG